MEGAVNSDQSWLHKLHQFVLGSPLPTKALSQEQLNKIRALAIFSPGALSSIAYANQEIYLALVAAGSAGLIKSIPVGLCIIFLLAIVVVSYYQTIYGYPAGGGSYIVAKENLGIMPGLVAAAALIIDYILTAAVSLSAGIDALISTFNMLSPYRLWLCLALLVLITLINLRGLRETGTAMAVPVYFFIGCYSILIIVGVYRLIKLGPIPMESKAPEAFEPLTLFLLLKAFSSGSTALTGVEAVSNGVPMFKSPQTKNAGLTLLIMGFLMVFLFFGTLSLTQLLAIIPAQDATILSALAYTIVGKGVFYYLIQMSTLLILIVAVNTSFAGFPRLAYIMASDGFLPQPLRQLGDRLVYEKSLIILSISAGLILIVFGGDTHSLIPLYAIGVFLAFTLSQMGMVIHWYKSRVKGWKVKALINSVGAAVTALTVIIIGISKFKYGAWLTLILIPTLTILFKRIGNHFSETTRELKISEDRQIISRKKLHLVLPVMSIDQQTLNAINCARMISHDITAVFVEIEPESGEKIKAAWEISFPDIQLIVVPSPYRSLIASFIQFLDQFDRLHDSEPAAVILPELIPAHLWQSVLHNQDWKLIRQALLYRRRYLGYQRIIIDVPFHLQ
jgi:amino acid transporter